MRLLMISHKETWLNPDAPGGYVTVGGFPFQLAAISSLFESTTLAVPIQTSALPAGAIPLHGRNIRVLPLAEPAGLGWRRKLGMIPWFLRHAARLWGAVGAADAIHTPVPGDIGFLGLLIALLQRKPLFVRHCGTWGEPVTLADKVLLWLLERIAGGRNVVLATGGADTPPSAKNNNIQWIFSTTLSENEMANTSIAPHWEYGALLQLITVGRLSSGKNTAAVIEALGRIEKEYPNIHLHIVGDGKERPALENLAKKLGVSNKVTLHGNISHTEVLQTLSRSHLFLFPTRVKEGFPKALLEAMACGLPVIATNVSIIPYLIRDCGILLSEPNAQSVAQAVLGLIKDAPLMRVLAMRARQVSRKYTIEGWQGEIRSCLESAWGPLKGI